MSAGTAMPGHGADDPDFTILPWDSEKFGFPVARLRRGMLPGDAHRAVGRMRMRGVVLAYYPAPSRLADEDAADLGATLADVRATFVRQVATPNVPSDLSRLASQLPDFAVESYQREEAEPTLIELAREAGRYSRFRVDPRIDVAVFNAIYDAWLTRSIRREIADDVYVARDAVRPVGLLTVGVAGGGRRGAIGLLSVHESVRGRGLGRHLADLAYAWSAARGLSAIQVATQVANGPACALYEAAGYMIEAREPTYHLWLR